MAETHSIEYRTIPGYPAYRVGSDGSVWACKQGTWERKTLSRQRHRNPGRAYLYVRLWRNNTSRKFFIQRLVLEAFVSARPEGMESRHLDGDPTNNHLSNLCWGTPKENATDNILMNRYVKGSTHLWAKITEADVRAIRNHHANGTMKVKDLAKLFGITQGAVRAIIRRRNWKHVI